MKTLKKIGNYIKEFLVIVFIVLGLIGILQVTAYKAGKYFTAGVIDQLEETPLNIKQTYSTEEN